MDAIQARNEDRPIVQVDSDYEGYFAGLVNRWIEEKAKQGKRFNHKVVSISAGPWRMAAVSFETFKEEKRIHLDFYSALRVGFGSLSRTEVEEIEELL